MHERLFKARLSDRLSADFCDGGLEISFQVDALLGNPESYKITEKNGAWCVVGSDELGLYYGVGKLLHSAKWGKDSFSPVATDGVVSAACDFRAIYFAIHFYNWYQNASIEELERYLEDLLLWGYNTIV